MPPLSVAVLLSAAEPPAFVPFPFPSEGAALLSAAFVVPFEAVPLLLSVAEPLSVAVVVFHAMSFALFFLSVPQAVNRKSIAMTRDTEISFLVFFIIYLLI